MGNLRRKDVVRVGDDAEWRFYDAAGFNHRLPLRDGPGCSLMVGCGRQRRGSRIALLLRGARTTEIVHPTRRRCAPTCSWCHGHVRLERRASQPPARSQRVAVLHGPQRGPPAPAPAPTATTDGP